MKTEKEVRDLCSVIDLRLEYARGWKDGLTWTLGDQPDGEEPDTAAVSDSRIKASEYRQRTATQRPIIEILKAAGRPLSVTEIMRHARSQGHDLLRPSVQRALSAAKALGLVRTAGRGRYYIPREEAPE
ncbi:hypothetical protein [Inquilinus sp. CAU 1745]|uniref:hypothetical protein n=1 Tax=Inquilinus sp. CAU 1745 TaxID=3140369 RepID=UPI00325BF598